MIFTSLIFLFLFLPSVKLTYFVFSNRIRLQNLALMLFSLLFYYWGEKNHIVIMLACIFVNYSCGILIENNREPKQRKLWLIISIISSMSLLLYFKYFNFFLHSTAYIFHLNITQFRQIALPLGISFYTFHALSYVIDVYWKKVPAERNFIIFVCYVSLFPQLVAGPIVRYRDIRHSFYYRYTTRIGLRNGILRLCFGLGKKILIADSIAKISDAIFSLPHDQLTFGLAWLGAISYALQIYFDFSGYSDMAIGTGLMFGFKYKENFNFPYNATSIQEFWRKWHISLSSWFRDYVYIPLGGSHKSNLRTYFNLIIVFGLCGLWHGAHYTFIIWGLFHGLFLILERTKFGDFIKKLPKLFRHCYVFFVVTISWVFFRENHLDDAILFIKTMLIPDNVSIEKVGPHINIIVMLAYVAGILLSLGLNKRAKDFLTMHRAGIFILLYRYLSMLLGLLILLVSMLVLSNSSYSPFLYFRF